MLSIMWNGGLPNTFTLRRGSLYRGSAGAFTWRSVVSYREKRRSARRRKIASKSVGKGKNSTDAKGQVVF